MKYMLDTDICVTLIRGKSLSLLDKIESFSAGDLGLSVITVAELQHGVQKGQHRERNYQSLLEFLSSFEIANFDSDAATTYGYIRSDLERMGKKIGPHDFLIAAHAKTLGVTLVTGNVREFNRVDGLIVENWLR